MKQGRSTGNPTQAQKARFMWIKQIGCVCCWAAGLTEPVLPEIHHLTRGGKHGQVRRGHDYTIGLCAWHHRGDPGHQTEDFMAENYGPSYARQPRLFREQFGDDDTLLAFQNDAIAIATRSAA